MSDVGPMRCPPIQPSGNHAKRWFVRVIIVALLLVATGIGVCAYIGISTYLYAERALHAVNAVTVVVDCFVKQENRWPKSWDDLKAVSAVDSPLPMYSWPDDVNILQRFVAIEFGTNLETIASQSVDDFNAIEPIGACYPYKHYRFVDALIRDVGALVDGQNGSRVPLPAN